MSGSLVALCADTTSLQHPESIGLAGENLAAQDWLRIFSSAEAVSYTHLTLPTKLEV